MSAETSLDPVDWTPFRQQAHETLDDALDYCSNQRELRRPRPYPD